MALSTGASPARQTLVGRLQDADPGWGVLLVVLSAVTLIRIVSLIVSPSELGFDEAQYWAWSREFAFGYFTKPPLIAWVISLENDICGSGAACVRMASPIFHLGTAIFLALAAHRLYGRKVGFWTGIFYAIMPGVAVSSFLITTDVFLLFFWSLAFLALVIYLERPTLGTAVAFGLAVGFGLYAKYAMIYLPVMLVLVAVAVPSMRPKLLRPELGLALLVALLVISPNLWWNATNSFATFEHTGDNIGWSLSRLNLVGGFEFLGAQFGVVGPFVFLAMIAALRPSIHSDRPETDRLLLWLSWPVLVAITIQGFLSQANPNWGATAYPAGLVLAAAIIVQLKWWRYLTGTLVFGAFVSVVLVLGVATLDPQAASGPLRQARQLGGWSETASGVAAVAREAGADRVVVEGRGLTAGMIHALRDEPVEVLAFLPVDYPPRDQFELDRPWHPGEPAGNTIFIGFREELAAELGLQRIATIDAPIYSQRDGRMEVYGMPTP